MSKYFDGRLIPVSQRVSRRGAETPAGYYLPDTILSGFFQPPGAIMAGPAGDFPVSYQYNGEFIGGLRERRYYPTASATKKDQGLGYNLSRRCFQTIRTIPTARTAIPTSSTGFVTSRLTTIRIIPRKVVAIVGDGGLSVVGI